MTAAPLGGASHRHQCAVAHGEQGRARLAADWVREGLALGERIVWIQPEDGALLGWLDTHGVDWREPLEAGALRMAPPEAVVRLDSADDVPLRVANAVELAHQAVADGYTGLRMGVETALALTVMPDVPTQMAFEAAWEQATLTEPLSLQCMYDPAVYGAQLSDGIRLHPREFTDGLAAASADGPTVALRGEVDLSNAAMIRDFLDAAVIGVEAPRIDLVDCRFVDLAGASELVAHARACAPRRVRVLNPPHSLRRALEVTHRAHELELVGAGT